MSKLWLSLQRVDAEAEIFLAVANFQDDVISLKIGFFEPAFQNNL